ncbi:MAG: YhdH/YhfP family quinone oxidoreductase [Gammaproteobacteria bacterium]|tara:strand:- start:123 stop:1112 length:990 start_codon:yes stop_codon:yes gene_type:complete
MKEKYQALEINYKKNKHSISIIDKYFRKLKKNEVLVQIKYSSLNYKDALSVTGRTKIIREEILVPGLDFSGIVVESSSKKFTKGEKVLATGSGLGETIDGGFSEYAYVPEDILIKIPKNLSLRSSMQIGTAGFTAAISIGKMLLNKQKIKSGQIIISGASGGVGSLCINILKKIGFKTVAITRNIKQKSYLEKIGANKVITYPKELVKKPLNNILCAGAIDNVGGEILDWIIKSTKDSGNIVSVGMASNYQLNTTVFPLIMRGVNILGVTSTNYPNSERKKIWQKLSTEYKPTKLKIITKNCISLREIESFSKYLIKGKSNGRTIIKIS